MTFDAIWAEMLVAADAAPAGEIRRRIHPSSVADLWLVMFTPSRTRALRVSAKFPADAFELLPATAGIEVRGSSDAVEVVLANPSFADLFDTLVADIAGSAGALVDTAAVPEAVAGRVRRWQAFLRDHSDGLSAERQRGLYGELHVLHFAIESAGPAVVSGWTGPFGTSQDFVFGGTAVEVKTSAGKNPQRVRISSERQLDDTALAGLYLWHLSVDERVGNGDTLPQLVDRLRSRLFGLQEATAFEDSLFAAGFHDAHRAAYLTGYTLRASTLHEVRHGFPRITEADCSVGLGDVHYSLELGALEPFRTERARLSQDLRRLHP